MKWRRLLLAISVHFAAFSTSNCALAEEDVSSIESEKEAHGRNHPKTERANIKEANQAVESTGSSETRKQTPTRTTSSSSSSSSNEDEWNELDSSSSAATDTTVSSSSKTLDAPETKSENDGAHATREELVAYRKEQSVYWMTGPNGIPQVLQLALENRNGTGSRRNNNNNNGKASGEDEIALLFVLLYTPSCFQQQDDSTTINILATWQRAAQELETQMTHQSRTMDLLSPPLLATMELSSFSQYWKQQQEQASSSQDTSPFPPLLQRHPSTAKDPGSATSLEVETLPAIAIVVGRRNRFQDQLDNNGMINDVKLWNVIQDVHYDYPLTGSSERSQDEDDGHFGPRTVQRWLFESSSSIVDLYWHYYARLVALPKQLDGKITGTAMKEEEEDARGTQNHQQLRTNTVRPLRVDSLSHVHTLVCDWFDKLFSVVPYLPLPHSTFLREHNRRRNLVHHGPQSSNNRNQDDFVVFIQCQRHNDSARSVPQEGTKHNRGRDNKRKNKPTDKNHKDTYHVLSMDRLYDAFQLLAHTMFPRQDLLHVTVSNCWDPHNGREMTNGSVAVWRYNSSSIDDDKDKNVCHLLSSHEWSPAWNDSDNHDERKKDEENNNRDEVVDSLVRFHNVHATPTVIWYDSKLAAPILLDHPVQALLFVNLHPFPPDMSVFTGGQSFDGPSNAKQQQEDQQVELVRQFGRLCQDWRHGSHHQCSPHNDNDTTMICVLVPSTETRLLTTFGVDIWSPLDQHLVESMELLASGGASDVDPKLLRPPQVVPQLVMVDSRPRQHGNTSHIPKSGPQKRKFGGPLELYRLTEPTTTSLTDFVQEFWDNQLLPERKSSASRTSSGAVYHEDNNDRNEDFLPVLESNEYGVSKLTGHYWRQASMGGSRPGSVSPPTHSLILFVSPTCGHCKRILVMFSQLSVLFGKAPGWRDLLKLFVLDVSTDQITTVHPVRWVPELLYVKTRTSTFGSGNKTHPHDLQNDYGQQYQVPFNQEPYDPNRPHHRKYSLLGEIPHYTSMLEWLIQVMELDDDTQWKTLLEDLQEHIQKQKEQRSPL